MESNTKKYVSKYDAKKLFEESGVGAAEIVKECETGEFNTVYSVRSNGKRYYLKFGSDDSTPTLNYEKDMLRAELAAYAALEGTDVLRPTIVFADTSREKINVDYFITEGLDAPLQGLTFPNLKARKRVMYQLGADVAKIHAVKGTEFGYFQFGKKPTWAEAYKLTRCSTESRTYSPRSPKAPSFTAICGRVTFSSTVRTSPIRDLSTGNALSGAI